MKEVMAVIVMCLFVGIIIGEPVTTFDTILGIIVSIWLLLCWVMTYEPDEFEDKGWDVVLKSILTNDVIHHREKEFEDYKEVVFWRAYDSFYNRIEFQIGRSFWTNRKKIKVRVTHMDYKNGRCVNVEDCKKRTFKCEEDVNELLEIIEDATEKFYTKRGYRLFL
jgi:hypothetical protein